MKIGTTLEVLDWGGKGRPLVLLAGLGSTAHVFDGFAEKLADSYHVYGITRRAYGASSRPASGYTEERLAADDLSVFESLGLVKPIVAGHSVAGNELSQLGIHHHDRISELVYLEALNDGSDDYTDYDAVTAKLPEAMKKPPSPTPSDLKSFPAYDFSYSRRNLIVGMLDVPLMYSVQVALAAERWRRVHGHVIGSWLSAMGTIEALICLGTYSYEHPNDPFPEFIQSPPCFDATEIGHPLIPAATCIRNDVRLNGGTRVLLVSGSNMSGKSTLLRTVGINALLAMAGAPVRAQRLRLTPLQVGASIRINDSLQEGSSRFYAEITRLRKLFDLAGGDPTLLFLLDELLQGTNSHDRRLGAEGILCALLNREAVGLVSTHDLALAEMDGALNGQLHNVHFQEEFESGRMSFDYKLQEGVVTKGNGLALMRSIGLNV